MLKEQIQQYFDRNKGNSRVENISSIKNHFSQFYKLGKKLENGTTERVNYALVRAEKIFLSLFENDETEIFTLIYEFPEPNCFNAPNQYLHSQFFNILEKQTIFLEEVTIYIYKSKLKDIHWKNILCAIANTEMGFEPAIDQKIFFFDIEKNNDFYMYDDRGCLSNNSL
ncbi:MAG: hypothetical protein RLZZ540_715 [Bacteroidota bacterium]|jgi:hypothetical protein